MTGELGRLIQAHKDEQPYRVSNAAMAAALGVTRTTVGNWMAGDAMPSPDNLRRLASLIGRPYSRVLDAALADAGYLAKEREDDGHKSAPIDVTEADAEVLVLDSELPTAAPTPRSRGNRAEGLPG